MYYNNRDEVLPYCFPTTVVLVDDDPSFLENFSLRLDEGLAYRMFDSAQGALWFLQQARQAPLLYQRCCSLFRDGVGSTLGDQFLRFDVSLLEKEVDNPDRFGEVSVVLVDYDMPEMNGLEFCRRINNPLIRKVLFTGVADEKIAVAAFNEGLIDRFIRKSDPAVGDVVNQTIQELQHQYLRATSQVLTRAIQEEPAVYLADPAFYEYFNSLCRREGFVEYYLAVEPGGFLCVTADGEMRRLLVLTDSDMQAHWEVATDQECPAELADLLRRRQVVPSFPTDDGFYRPECSDWRQYVHQPEVVQGRQPFYVALLRDAQFGRTSSGLLSYKAYLNRLDSSTSPA